MPMLVQLISGLSVIIIIMQSCTPPLILDSDYSQILILILILILIPILHGWLTVE